MLSTIDLYVLEKNYYLIDDNLKHILTQYYGVELLNINDYFLIENGVIYNIVDNFGIIRLFTLMYFN